VRKKIQGRKYIVYFSPLKDVKSCNRPVEAAVDFGQLFGVFACTDGVD
jgi:hypothetical protein